MNKDREELYREKLLLVFKTFISICDRYDLRYYAAFGTVIGAVRHHGLIPWDDDVDVMMPRPDYERFIHICQTSDIGEYEIVTPRNRDNYYLTFSKFCDRNSTIAERQKSKCVFGVFIDIFPIDGVPDNIHDCEDLVRRYNNIKNELSWVSNEERFVDFPYMLGTFQIKRFIKSFLFLFRRKTSRQDIVDNLEQVCSSIPFETSDNCIVYAEEGTKGVFPKSWLDKPKSLPFEFFTVRVPGKFDEYLTQLYGDYMQLPPENERESRHLNAMFFLDLEKRVELKDIWK